MYKRVINFVRDNENNLKKNLALQLQWKQPALKSGHSGMEIASKDKMRLCILYGKFSNRYHEKKSLIPGEIEIKHR